jgi:Flp pilus assembly protein TadG
MIRSDKGVSAVEFALIAPLLFVLTFGIIEFSLLLFDKAVLTNASREGARAAIVYRFDGKDPDPLDQAEVEAVVKNYAEQHLISLGSTSPLEVLDLEYSPAGAPGTTPNQYVTVTVNYTYRFLVFQALIKLLGGGGFDAGIALQGITVMRMEY